MKVVVIGYGSIGKRHVDNLIALGINEIVLCRSTLKGNNNNLKEINRLEDIISINPGFVIVSNPTSKHFEVLEFLIKNQFNILCEKPLVHKPEQLLFLKELLNDYKGIARVVFNLRFHPCIQKTREIIKTNKLGRIHFARFFVGQYLPDWRPNTNHLESYSASKEMGGGVVLDLVHEIDIAEYLFGSPDGVINSLVDRVSKVTVDSPDVAEVLYKSEDKVVINIHMDYLYRGYARHFLICGSNFNLKCDLFENTIQISGDKNEIIETFKFSDFERNDMYYGVLEDFIEVIKNKKSRSTLPSFLENESVMNTCFQVIN